MSMNGDLYSLWVNEQMFESESEKFQTLEFKVQKNQSHCWPEHNPKMEIIYTVAGFQDEWNESDEHQDQEAARKEADLRRKAEGFK